MVSIARNNVTAILQHDLRPLLLLELRAFNLHVFTHHARKPELGASHVLFEVRGLGPNAVALDLKFLPGVLDGFAGEAAGETVGGAIEAIRLRRKLASIAILPTIKRTSVSTRG